MTAAPKKMLMLAILETLRTYTDAEHRMRQADIAARIEADYGLTVTRKSIHVNLTELVSAGYPLEYKDGWYYEHEFSTAELNLLMDGLIYNPNIPYAQCREMAAKVRALGGKWYKPAPGQSLNRPANPQFMYSLDVLHEAIAARRRVKFQYGDYAVDKRLHPRLDKNGEPKEYEVNPYRIVISNGRHYLIGNVHKYDNAAHFRIDRIMNLEETRLPAKEPGKVRGLDGGLRVSEYLTGHAHMFSGDVIQAKLQIQKTIINETLDWFGMDVTFAHETADTVEATLRTDENSLHYWLKMYDEFARRI